MNDWIDEYVEVEADRMEVKGEEREQFMNELRKELSSP